MGESFDIRKWFDNRDKLLVISGPCSVESREQLLATAAVTPPATREVPAAFINATSDFVFGLETLPYDLFDPLNPARGLKALTC